MRVLWTVITSFVLVAAYKFTAYSRRSLKSCLFAHDSQPIPYEVPLKTFSCTNLGFILLSTQSSRFDVEPELGQTDLEPGQVFRSANLRTIAKPAQKPELEVKCEVRHDWRQ
jgi:hypothetical protein